MRKLDRSRVAAPECLSLYKHGTHRWEHVEGPEKQQIRARLEAMQGHLCAYCEGPLDDLGQHIDHFRCRAEFPKLTFAWANLYWSCYQDSSCGRHKDQDAGEYDSNEILDPCCDDPDRFFHFRSDGAIHVRSGLSAKDQRRAEETLRVFNLDPKHGRLRSMRRRALESYTALEPGIMEALAELDPDDRRTFVIAELKRTAGEPFSVVIRHFFEGL